MRHLLVTNDFPPKVGGIQSYLGELWRRLPPDDVCVLTPRHPDAPAWDQAQPYRIVRSRRWVFLPTPGLLAEIDRVADDHRADVVVVDPILLHATISGRLARSGRRSGVIVHGAEVTIVGRNPLIRPLIEAGLRRSELVISAGEYPLAESERAARRRLRSVTVPPGVDVDRFRPVTAVQRAEIRRRFGLAADDLVVVSVSRLVPRKGMDVLIRAAARLARAHPRMVLAIGGTGRDRARLERIARREGAPVRFLGRVAEDELPGLYAASDLFAMLCRDRWFGLEQEGFGIVFLEAAACGVPQVAGRSGGSHEAVAHGETGLVVDDPRDVGQVADALSAMLEDEACRARMGAAARSRAEADFDYDLLAPRLDAALTSLASTAPVPQ